MDENKEQSIYPESASRLICQYSVMRPGSDLTDLLTNFLMLTHQAVYVANDTARNVTQARNRDRGVYTGVSKAVMEYQLPKSIDDTDQVIEELSIEFITTAINAYLDKHQEMPDLNTRSGVSEYNKVMVLVIQLYTTNGRNLLPDLHFPDYVKEKLNIIDADLSKDGEKVFIEWLEKLESLGNGHLVPIIENYGPDIFGINSKSDPSRTWGKFMQPYMANIKNYHDTYEAYKQYRGAYLRCTKSIKKQDLYDYFGFTADKYTKLQKKLYVEFQEDYMNDMNSQYLKNLINGTED